MKSKSQFKALILAGGVGSRLWPLSRKNSPKQMKALLNNKTVLQNTYEAIRKGFAKEDIFVITTRDLQADIRAQLPIPITNIISEPQRRETAAAIGLGAWLIEKKYPGSIIVTINSDHYIGQVKEYIRVIKLAGRFIAKHADYLLTVEINPTYPETGFGYIKIGQEFNTFGRDKVFEVDSFKEKPTLAVAEKYLDDWRYLWNAALFCFSADTLKAWYKKYLPSHYRSLEQIADAGVGKYPAVLVKEYQKIKPVAIDYGLVEKLDKLLVLPASFRWHDIGHWRTIADILPSDKHGNTIKALHVGVDSNRNLIYAEPKKLVATVGLHDFIIVDTSDALLICSKDKAQRVKQIVDEIKKKKLDNYV